MLTYPRSARGDARAIYPYARREHADMMAIHALTYARHLATLDELEELYPWTWRDGDCSGTSPFMTIDVPGGQIRAYWDPEPYEEGDVELTEQERADLSVIGLGLRYAGADHDEESVWGYGFFGAGYDVEREAYSFLSDLGYLDLLSREVVEASHWAARDVVTVDA